jgi:hypothetical protein
MAWDVTVDPVEVYNQWEHVSTMLDPGSDYRPRLDAAGGVEATLSHLSARRSVWAAACLTAGFASENDQDTGLLTIELAQASTEPWATTELTMYCATHDNLGWAPEALVNSARLMIATIPLPILSTAEVDIGRWQLCMRRHNGDSAAVIACVRNAEATLAQPVG